MTALLAATTAATETSFANVGWIAWIIIGGLAGWVASKIMGTDAQQGVVLNVVVGVIGGLLGGVLLNLLQVSTAGFGWILTFVTALIGACILLFLVKLVVGRK